MNKRYPTGMMALVWATALTASAATVQAGAPVLFVAPVRSTVIRVLQDVVRRHPGHTLVSYQQGPTSDSIALHVWRDNAWAPLTLDAYAGGRFPRVQPKRALLFGPDTLLPERLVKATGWVPVVLNVPELDTASLLNAAGRLLNFRSSEWRWFARRYELDLTDANEPLRGESWYDQPHDPRRFEAPPVPVPPRRRRTPVRREPVRNEVPMPPAPEPEPPPEVRERPAPPEPDEAELPGLPVPLPAAPEPAEDDAVKGPPAPQPGLK